MTTEEINQKMETALDIIMDHFSETLDRMAEMEKRIEELEEAVSARASH